MQIAVHGRHVEIGEDLRSLAAEKLVHLERFLDGTERAEVLFVRDHAARDDGHVSCEVTILARGRSIRSKATGHVPAVALEAAVEKEMHRLTRMKDRLVQRSRPRHGIAGRPDTETGG